MSYHDDGGPADKATLRDYFAAQALQGCLADPVMGPDDGEAFEDFARDVSEACYIYADAMLEARKCNAITH